MIEFLGRNLHFIILTDYNRTRGDNPLLEEDCFYISYKNILEENEANMTCLDSLVLAETPGGGGYSIYPWVGRCSPAPYTLTLFKTKIDTLFKTFVEHTRRLFIVQEKIPCLRQKLIKSIPCLRQKSLKTYPGCPHVPI